MKRVVLVTGGSSGIGRAIVELFVQKGYEVLAASRSANSIAIEGARNIVLDVTDAASVQSVMSTIEKDYGALFALINSAGLGMVGSIEDTTPEELQELFQTNLLGVHHMCKYALPLLRKCKRSYIVNITSMAAQMALPYRGIYCASKFAVEGYTESLSQEVRADGIRAVIVEPGDVLTSINSNRKVVSNLSPHHAAKQTAVHRQINREVELGWKPERIAQAVYAIVQKKEPRLRYRVAGFNAKLAYYMMRLLPDRWFEQVIMRHYGI